MPKSILDFLKRHVIDEFSQYRSSYKKSNRKGRRNSRAKPAIGLANRERERPNSRRGWRAIYFEKNIQKITTTED